MFLQGWLLRGKVTVKFPIVIIMVALLFASFTRAFFNIPAILAKSDTDISGVISQNITCSPDK